MSGIFGAQTYVWAPKSHTTLTAPLLGVIGHPRLGLATVNLSTKFDISVSTNYEDIKGDTNVKNGGSFG